MKAGEFASGVGFFYGEFVEDAVDTIRDALMASLSLTGETYPHEQYDDALAALSVLAERLEAAEGVGLLNQAAAEQWEARAVAAEARLQAATDALRAIAEWAKAPKDEDTAFVEIRRICREVET